MDFSGTESKILYGKESPDIINQNSYIFGGPIISSVTETNFAKLDGSPSLSRLSNSTYSKEYIKDIETHQNKAQKYNLKKIESQGKSYEKIKNALAGQLSSLKQQLELNEELQGRELDKIKEEYEIRLENIDKDRHESASRLRREIEKYEEILSVNQRQFDEYEYEYEHSRMNIEDQIENLKKEVEEIVESIDYHKELLEVTSKKEVEDINKEISCENQQHILNLEKIKAQSSSSYNELLPRLEAKDKLIQNLEYEIIELRNHILSLKETAAKDILSLRDTMRSSQRVIEAQQMELKRLKSNHISATSQAELLSKEASLLENEYARLKRDNSNMWNEIQRLEDLVYGKNMDD
ncbi:unnamed protein product [Blepharisma stoltei]|uniref:Uncharacterized protein n=1 Tax=Blepharisma stoltei TaxID=1481888 RepID=A0AAU9IMQ5_9CILI|nr:unnamed protein product [Blepharisma stoltei]